MSTTGHSLRSGAMPALLVLGMLAGCGIDKNLRLDRQGPGLAPGAAVAIQPATPESETSARFAAALAEAFAARGHAVASTAPVTALFGFTRRPRAIGTADGSPAGSDGAQADVVWISAPASKRAFQACDGERIRATLALYSREDKALIYRGTAESDGCDFTKADVDALAKALVVAASR
jgi:hypothetical protein